MKHRNGRKVSEIPAKELEEIRAYERSIRKRKRDRDAKASAKKLRERLAADIKKPITSQVAKQIEMGERQKSFVHFFYKYGGNIAAACHAAGITRSTFTRWLANYPELSEQITEVNEAMLDLAEQQLLENIKAGKEQSLFFFLCNKGKHRGWQDVRKLSAPKLQGIKININYPKDRPKLSGTINTEIIDVESEKVHETGSGRS